MNEQAILIPVTEVELKNFIADLESKVNEYERENYPNTGVSHRSIFEFSMGKKYARVTKRTAQHAPGSGGCYCFIRLEDGAIFKAASFKAPAKHARGNIRREWWNTALGPFGAAYRR